MMETKIIESAFRCIVFNISPHGRRINRFVDKADVRALLCDLGPGLPIGIEVCQHKLGWCSVERTEPLVENSFQNRSWPSGTCTAIDVCVVTRTQWQL